MKRWLAAAALVATGCAQIESHSTVQVVPRPELEPKWFGEAKTVVGRDLALDWSQSLSTVELSIRENRRCRAVLHEPVDRVETIDRTVKHGALYWEYGAGAAILAVGLAALIKPEAFSNQAVDANGNAARDTTTGYRLGGIFTALGAALVGVGAYDTVRSRDRVETTRAYRVTTGDETPCVSPDGPKAGVEVELAIGPWTSKVKTDVEGHARFGLPNEDAMGIALPEPAREPTDDEPTDDEPTDDEPTEPAPDEEARPPEPPPRVEVTATVRVEGRVASFTVLAPLSEAKNRSGSATLVPDGPPRPEAAHP